MTEMVSRKWSLTPDTDMARKEEEDPILEMDELGMDSVYSLNVCFQFAKREQQ